MGLGLIRRLMPRAVNFTPLLCEQAHQNWPRLLEQIFRFDKWSVYRG